MARSNSKPQYLSFVPLDVYLLSSSATSHFAVDGAPSRSFVPLAPASPTCSSSLFASMAVCNARSRKRKTRGSLVCFLRRFSPTYFDLVHVSWYIVWLTFALVVAFASTGRACHMRGACGFSPVLRGIEFPSHVVLAIASPATVPTPPSPGWASNLVQSHSVVPEDECPCILYSSRSKPCRWRKK